MAYRIWSLTDMHAFLATETDSPTLLNYKTQLNVRLHPKLTFEKGQLVRVEYFEDKEQELPVLDVVIAWVRDEDGVLVERVETRNWHLMDGKFGTHAKTTRKFYDAEGAARADVRRRGNVVAEMTAMAAKFHVLPQVQAMFIALNAEITAYEKTGDASVIAGITNYDGAWLGKEVPGTSYTLRQTIVAWLTL